MKTKTWMMMAVLLVVVLAACSAQPAEDTVNENQPAAGGENAAGSNDPAESGDDAGAGNQADNQAEAENNTADSGDSAEEPAGDAADEVSFSEDVFPILSSRCLTCHGGDRIEGGLVLLTYADLMAGGEDGAVVVPGDAAGSLLYQLTESGEMPKRGANLTPVQLAVLEQWINAGALDN